MGFATPINVIRKMIPRLLRGEKFAWGWLGVQMAEVSLQQTQTLGLPSNGVVVSSVLPGQPAAHVGIRKRDVILSVNGIRVDSPKEVARMIGGFEEVTAGRIFLGDDDVTDLPPFKRATNTVFQNYALFPHLSIYENVAFGLRRKGVKDSEIRSRVTEMLRLVELPGFERRRPSQISGGQPQRVALARALINRPAVLLLDEPLGALDLKLRKQMQVELKRIQQEVGITFIYVTHDQEEAMTMSDRIAVMSSGHYEQLGDPENLYERPATRFVAGFLGVSNLLPGRLAGADGEYRVVRLADDTDVRVPSGLVDGQQDVEIGVRPEKIRLVAAAETVGGGLNRLSGTIDHASYMGVSTQYQIRTLGGQTITVYEQNVERTVHGSLHQRGQQVHLTWSPDHTFVVAKGGDEPEPAPSEDSARTSGGVR